MDENSLIERKRRNYYVFLPRHIFDQNDKFMNVDELYLYVYLKMNRNIHTNVCHTNFDILNDQLLFLKKRRNNLARIEDVIVSLCKKGYLSIDEYGEDMKKASILRISVISQIGVKANYFKVSYQLFEDVHDSVSYAILAYIKCVSWHKRSIRNSEFCERLIGHNGNPTSKSTIVRRMKELVKCGLLGVLKGDKYCINDEKGEWMQAANKFTVNETGIDIENCDDVTMLDVLDESILDLIGREDYFKRLIGKLPRKLEYKHYKWIHEYPVHGLKDMAYDMRLNVMSESGFDFRRWNERLEGDRGKIKGKVKRSKDTGEGEFDLNDDPFQDYIVG